MANTHLKNCHHFVPVIVFVQLFLGCGYEPEVHRNRVAFSGSVRYKGSPLPGGTVTVMSKVNPSQIAATSIYEDGSFKVSDAPIGSVLITVSTVGEHLYDPNKVPKIPAKYGNPKTSGFSAELAADEVNTIDLKLE